MGISLGVPSLPDDRELRRVCSRGAGMALAAGPPLHSQSPGPLESLGSGSPSSILCFSRVPEM